MIDAEFAERRTAAPVFLSKSAQTIENKGRRLRKERQESSRVRKRLRNRGLRHGPVGETEGSACGDQANFGTKRGKRFEEGGQGRVSSEGWATIMADDTDLVI
jgi:hypothetical protein